MTSTLTTSISSNTLEEFQMIAGDEQEFTYNVYDSEDEEVNLNGATCSVVIFRYGDPGTVLVTLEGAITSLPTINQFTCVFSSSSSIDLSGVYQQQVKIIDYLGVLHVPSQGKIIIFPSTDD